MAPKRSESSKKPFVEKKKEQTQKETIQGKKNLSRPVILSHQKGSQFVILKHQPNRRPTT